MKNADRQRMLSRPPDRLTKDVVKRLLERGRLLAMHNNPDTSLMFDKYSDVVMPTGFPRK
jgi:hypothetical protein